MHLCTMGILLLILHLELPLSSALCALDALVQWELSYMSNSLQYEYHKEHKDDSYALTLHSRFSITLMHIRHMSHGVKFCVGEFSSTVYRLSTSLRCTECD